MKCIILKEVGVRKHWGCSITTYLGLYKSETDEGYFEIHEQDTSDTGYLDPETPAATFKIASISDYGVTIHLKGRDLKLSDVRSHPTTEDKQCRTVISRQFDEFCQVVYPGFVKEVMKAVPEATKVEIYIEASKNTIPWIAIEYFLLFSKLWADGKMMELSEAYTNYAKQIEQG